MIENLQKISHVCGKFLFVGENMEFSPDYTTLSKKSEVEFPVFSGF
jgi:hypothetical protein